MVPLCMKANEKAVISKHTAGPISGSHYSGEVGGVERAMGPAGATSIGVRQG